MQLSVIVPTYNEAPNVAELVRRVSSALQGTDVEIVFVDDSTDDTPRTIAEVAATAPVPVRLIHRDVPRGGLGGAVVEGFRAAAFDACLVMDGDLQHPPETIPVMTARLASGDVDLVVASRYRGDGSAAGLADATRVLVSRGSTLVTRAMFPLRLREVTDPMTGFFLVDRRALDLPRLQPRGFKILLEVLTRLRLRVAEVPFEFGDRFAGQSKASLRQGVHFLLQLAALRFGKMSRFALIGGLGAVINIAIVALLTAAGLHYVVAAVVAAEVTIVGNFFLIERFVFRDLLDQAAGRRSRFLKSFGFNNAEALVRIPIVTLMVETGRVSAVIATAMTLAVAFLLRFVFHSLVVYAPTRKAAAPSHDRAVLGSDRST